MGSAFITTLDQPELVGLDPAVTLHLELDAHPLGHHGPSRVCDAFFVVKLLQDSGYDGPIHFAVHPDDDSADRGISPSGACAPTGRWHPRPGRFVDDPEIRDAVAQRGGLELGEPSVGPFSPESGRALSIECFDPAALSRRRYRSQRLDQLVVDLVLGLR
jgi:xylose isomerase